MCVSLSLSVRVLTDIFRLYSRLSLVSSAALSPPCESLYGSPEPRVPPDSCPFRCGSQSDETGPSPSPTPTSLARHQYCPLSPTGPDISNLISPRPLTKVHFLTCFHPPRTRTLTVLTGDVPSSLVPPRDSSPCENPWTFYLVLLSSLWMNV